MSEATMPREIGGVAGWLLGKMRSARLSVVRSRAERSLKLVETLSLGGRRQLMLVSCEKKKFLVGVGADGVQTIVAVEAVGDREVVR